MFRTTTFISSLNVCNRYRNRYGIAAVSKTKYQRRSNAPLHFDSIRRTRGFDFHFIATNHVVCPMAKCTKKRTKPNHRHWHRFHTHVPRLHQLLQKSHEPRLIANFCSKSTGCFAWVGLYFFPMCGCSSIVCNIFIVQMCYTSNISAIVSLERTRIKTA